jgi:hypothetical protein
MKASELRIGNWVSNYKDTPTQILEWTGNDAYLTKGRKAYGIKTSSPIPLTEEWLVKFGFESDHNDLVLFYKQHVLMEASWASRNIRTDEKYGWAIYLPNITIQYVHQLQNLYFALTGEELEE